MANPRQNYASIHIDARSLKEFNKALRKVSQEVRRRGMVNGIRRGARVIVTAARKETPTDTGTLKKSLGVVVRNARSKHKDPYAVYGPRSGFKREFGDGVLKIPAYYGHLVEFGRKGVKGKGFLRRGTQKALPKVSVEMIKQVKRTQEKAAAKYKARRR